MSRPSHSCARRLHPGVWFVVLVGVAFVSTLLVGSARSATEASGLTIRFRPTRQAPVLPLRPSRILTTPTAVLDLSADAGGVAVATDCEPVGIASARGGFRWLRGSAGCHDEAVPNDDLVLAGLRVAWTEETDTNTLAWTMLKTGTPGSGVKDLVMADHDDDLYLGNLAGDGSLLVYNTWKRTWPKGYEHPSVVSEQKLWRVVSSGRSAKTRLLLAGTGAVDVVAVDAGRIAVLRGDGTLVILNESGKRLSAFRLGRAGIEVERCPVCPPHHSVFLTGHRLVVLRGTKVEVRDATTGALLARWPTATGAGSIALEDAEGNFAAYTAGMNVHLLRLSDGRDRQLAIAKQAGPTHAQVEPEGLYVSFNPTGKAKSGRVAFMRLSELTATFR